MKVMKSLILLVNNVVSIIPRHCAIMDLHYFEFTLFQIQSTLAHSIVDSTFNLTIGINLTNKINF